MTRAAHSKDGKVRPIQPFPRPAELADLIRQKVRDDRDWARAIRDGEQLLAEIDASISEGRPHG